jgi:formamidopyrimidine-DNA glycosylase
MPELPEVETVRAGLDRFVVGRTITAVEVRHPRSVRRHLAGQADLVARLTGARLLSAHRRGKYLWLPLSTGAAGAAGAAAEADQCLVGHLGMSGQFLVAPVATPDQRHLHVRLSFADGGSELRFVDQRTFGGVLVDDLVPCADVPGDTVPARISHIARDPLDHSFDEDALIARIRNRSTAIKRALLDQSLVSGIGNIYADESLWRARLHGGRLTAALSRPRLRGLLSDVRAVLGEAIGAGGTSFDALYVNVNGQSGYFSRTLAVYGRDGLPCLRCGTAVRRVAFMNRSSYFCPHCQRPPRL